MKDRVFIPTRTAAVRLDHSEILQESASDANLTSEADDESCLGTALGSAGSYQPELSPVLDRWGLAWHRL